jgi:general secretion pathway protein I
MKSIRSNSRTRRLLNRRLTRVVRSGRDGLTLLEILLSVAIFFGALAVLSQLAWNGTRSAVQARLKTQAIIRCEAKLAEVLAGIEPMQPKSNVPFPDNAHWSWSLVVSETTFPELLQLDVTVSHSGNSRLANVSFSLRRWTRDPSSFLDAAVLKKQETSK